MGCIPSREGQRYIPSCYRICVNLQSRWPPAARVWLHLSCQTALKSSFVSGLSSQSSFFCCTQTVSPSWIKQPTDQTVNEGVMATLHCNATGNPTPKITWTKDGNTVATGKTLSFKVSRNQAGEYWCSAENGLGKSVNASAYLDVKCKYKLSVIAKV